MPPTATPPASAPPSAPSMPAHGGLTGAGLVAELVTACLLLAVPLVIVLLTSRRSSSPFGDLRPEDTPAVDTAVTAIATLSLTLAGLTFAAVAFLSTGSATIAASHQSALGFYLLAFLAYVCSAIVAKWLRSWTVFVAEGFRDAGTVLLLLGTTLLLFDFPGTQAWKLIAGLAAGIAVVFYVIELHSTWEMIHSAEDAAASHRLPQQKLKTYRK